MQPQVHANMNPHLIADFFLAKDEQRYESDVTQMKLHKLMYFAQAHYLAQTGCRLFNSDIHAYEHGPIVEAIYPTFRQYGRATIVVDDDNTAMLAVDRARELPHDVLNFLEKIWDYYGDYSASNLRNMSHADAPWVETYTPDTRKLVIPDARIRDYYQGQPENRPIIHPDNATFIPLNAWAELEEMELQHL